MQIIDLIGGFFTGAVYGLSQVWYHKYVAPARYTVFFVVRFLVVMGIFLVVQKYIVPSYLLFFCGFIFSLILTTLFAVQGTKWN
jgi:hypothetical protein